MRILIFLLLSVSFATMALGSGSRGEGLRETLEKVDALREAGEFAAAQERLQGLDREFGANGEVLWRLARGAADLGRSSTDAEERLDYYQKAQEYGKAAVQALPQEAEAFKWLAIAQGVLAEEGAMRSRIELSRQIKSNIERALALNPKDDLSWHVLGRWNLQVAEVGSMKRAFAGLVYGGLPEASLENAQRALQRAIALKERPLHYIYLGRVYRAQGEEEKARDALKRALEMPLTFPHEAEEMAMARRLLRELPKERR